MSKKVEKCVFILSDKLPPGLALNCTALLGSSLGAHYPELIGEDYKDADDVFHLGLLSLPIVILKANEGELIQIRHNALELEKTKCIDLTNISQEAMKYNDLIQRASKTRFSAFKYIAVSLFGDSGEIEDLTKNLKLY
ncbi:MAG: hypothetical protein CME68_08725 [Halobacteriovoraceae bacterium]|nr:hypothetical protein [Halobacteriovoraceae bacterium]